VVLQGGEGPPGQGLAPQLVGQAFLGHVVAARHQEQLEHLLGLGAAEIPRAETASTRCHLDGAEEPGPHRRRLRSRTGRTHGRQLSQPKPLAAQRVDLVYNRARTGAASETEATVTVSQEQAPEPPGRYREVCERFPEGPGQMLTGVWTQWPARRSTRSRCSRNWPRLLDPRESHSDQMGGIGMFGKKYVNDLISRSAGERSR
jgi:hypothetical protein